jgi:hypothetical protein
LKSSVLSKWRVFLVVAGYVAFLAKSVLVFGKAMFGFGFVVISVFFHRFYVSGSLQNQERAKMDDATLTQANISFLYIPFNEFT